MSKITMTIQPDIIEPLTKKKPFKGLCELVWNALDADATEINITYEQDHLPTSIRTITISDNGKGQSREEVSSSFGNFGGSLKRELTTTNLGRGVHGQYGKGRYVALSIAHCVEFKFFKDKKENTVTLTDVSKTDPSLQDEINTTQEDGCTVTLQPVRDTVKLEQLFSNEKINELKQHLCLYYEKNPTFKIVINSESIDFSTCKKNVFVCDGELQDIKEIQNFEDVTLRIVEWDDAIKSNNPNKIYFCRGEQVITEIPSYRSSSKPLSAFVSGKFIEAIDFEGQLKISEMDPPLKKVIDQIKDILSAKATELESKDCEEIITDLKRHHLYPYTEEPSTNLERREKHLFDVLASKIVVASSKYKQRKTDDKKVILNLVKQAVSTGSKELFDALREVLRLDESELEKFNQAVRESGGLIKIIQLATQVQDRLKVIEGIREIHHTPTLKKKVNERDHLHKIIQDETWLFDEDFALSVSERKLTQVLTEYIYTFDRKTLLCENNEEGKSSDRIDIGLFGKQIQAGRSSSFLNIVVELKRPSITLSSTEINQIMRYARQCAEDTRFPIADYNWDFYLIGGSLDRDVSYQRQDNTSENTVGMLHKSANTRIYVKTWDELLNQAEAKLNYLKKALEVSYRDAEHIGYEHLTKKYSSLGLPSVK